MQSLVYKKQNYNIDSFLNVTKNEINFYNKSIQNIENRHTYAKPVYKTTDFYIFYRLQGKSIGFFKRNRDLFANNAARYDFKKGLVVSPHFIFFINDITQPYLFKREIFNDLYNITYKKSLYKKFRRYFKSIEKDFIYKRLYKLAAPFTQKHLYIRRDTFSLYKNALSLFKVRFKHIVLPHAITYLNKTKRPFIGFPIKASRNGFLFDLGLVKGFMPLRKFLQNSRYSNLFRTSSFRLALLCVMTMPLHMQIINILPEHYKRKGRTNIILARFVKKNRKKFINKLMKQYQTNNKKKGV